MKQFYEKLRYEYSLNSDSLVLDVGAYELEFSLEMAKRYDCRIIAFEPIDRYFRNCVCSAMAYPKICVINSALSDVGAEDIFGISNNSSGKYSQQTEEQRVSVVKILPLLNVLGTIDVFKCNSEGAEYDLLKIMLDAEKVGHIKNLQIQFHRIGDWEAKYKAIDERLSVTHEPEWNSAPDWQNYKLRCD